MKLLKKIGFYLLIVAIISELVLPFVLGPFLTDYSQINQLISTFGETGMKTRIYFKIWEIINGTLFILAAPALFERFKKTSPKLSLGTAVSLGIFGLGDCILTGLTDRARTINEVGLESLIHNYASGAGFVALLFGTFFLIVLYYLEQEKKTVQLFSIIFILSSIFMFFFALPKIPFLATEIPYRGLWQRLNLFFLYLPFLITAIKNRNLGNLS